MESISNISEINPLKFFEKFLKWDAGYDRWVLKPEYKEGIPGSVLVEGSWNQ